MGIGKLKQVVRDMKLSSKMLLAYLALLLFTFLVAAWALQMSFRIYDGQLHEKSQQELDFFSQRVNSVLDELERVSMEVATDQMIQQELEIMMELPYRSAEYFYQLQELRELLMNQIISYPNIKYPLSGSRYSETEALSCRCSPWLELTRKCRFWEIRTPLLE